MGAATSTVLGSRLATAAEGRLSDETHRLLARRVLDLPLSFLYQRNPHQCRKLALILASSLDDWKPSRARSFGDLVLPLARLYEADFGPFGQGISTLRVPADIDLIMVSMALALDWLDPLMEALNDRPAPMGEDRWYTLDPPPSKGASSSAGGCEPSWGSARRAGTDRRRSPAQGELALLRIYARVNDASAKLERTSSELSLYYFLAYTRSTTFLEWARSLGICPDDEAERILEAYGEQLRRDEVDDLKTCIDYSVDWKLWEPVRTRARSAEEFSRWVQTESAYPRMLCPLAMIARRLDGEG